MKLALALCVVAASAEFDTIVKTVNSGNATWTAAVPTRSVEDFKNLCGTWMPGHPKYQHVELPEYGADENAVFDDSLDWRTKAPQCTVISKIRDQSACGSCWAFGSTETFEDRRCIATGKDTEFSTEDTAGCCSGFACGMSQGCNGGQPTAALQWMGSTGVVTGGDYDGVGKGASCKPYTLAPCAHHVPPGKYPACPSAEYSLKCTKSCSESSYSTSYSDDKVAEGSAKSCGSVASMMTALQKGPLSVAFTVYSDFPTYKSGVYKHTTGSALGGHAVEIIGYGTEGGEDYWLVKNSWNEEWGDGGTFKIARGSDECGIESSAAAIDFAAGPVTPTPAPAPTPAAPTPAPQTPTPAPGPAPATHYGDPSAGGCMSDEEAIQIQGVGGSVCSPACTGILKMKCPSDVPEGVTAAPQCALQDATTSSKYCALICSPSAVIKDQKLADAACGGTNLSCKAISGVGICTYDDGAADGKVVTFQQ